jgi:DNA-binding transcriptional MerR regulator
MLKAVASSPQKSGAARKLFYRIQEVAQMTGLKPYVLRYWESEFKELSPAKDASDQRRYRQSDIEVILAIRKLLYEERYTIKGARTRLRDELRKARGQAAAAQAEKILAPRPAPAKGRDPRLDKTLRRLRMEVNELINMLST